MKEHGVNTTRKLCSQQGGAAATAAAAALTDAELERLLLAVMCNTHGIRPTVTSNPPPAAATAVAAAASTTATVTAKQRAAAAPQQGLFPVLGAMSNHSCGNPNLLQQAVLHVQSAEGSEAAAAGEDNGGGSSSPADVDTKSSLQSQWDEAKANNSGTLVLTLRAVSIYPYLL